jgi:hypothetical protein
VSDEAFLILDMADAGNWFNGPVATSLMRIPPEKRPTVVQQSREVGEKEVVRLQTAHPQGRFVLFQAVAKSTLVSMPTHVNLRGEPLFHERIARLVEIHDAEAIPF